jgi:hypothetical protein
MKLTYDPPILSIFATAGISAGTIKMGLGHVFFRLDREATAILAPALARYLGLITGMTGQNKSLGTLEQSAANFCLAWKFKMKTTPETDNYAKSYGSMWGEINRARKERDDALQIVDCCADLLISLRHDMGDGTTKVTLRTMDAFNALRVRIERQRGEKLATN